MRARHCQRYSIAITNRYASKIDSYPDLIPSTREALVRAGRTYVIENVPYAPLSPDVVLCGSQFGLSVARHRLFESNMPLFQLRPSCAHASRLVGVYGTGTSSWLRKQRIKMGLPPHHGKQEQEAAMGIFHMSAVELTQAIPPAYTEYIGRQLLAHLREKGAPDGD